MMKSFFKKLAFVMALAMVVSLAAPAATTAAAAEESPLKIAYQGGMAITEVNLMSAGDFEDLRFLGVSNWKELGGAKWSSNNEAVATVDQAGLVTAVAEGTAVVTVTIGDMTASVTVNVGTLPTYTVTIGDETSRSVTEKTLKIGDSVDFAFYGIKDYSRDKIGTLPRYLCTWQSDDTTVLTKDNEAGLFTAVKAGTAKVTLTVANVLTGKTHNVIPVLVTVAADATPTPTPCLVENPVNGGNWNATQNTVMINVPESAKLEIEDVELYHVFTADYDANGDGLIDDRDLTNPYEHFYVKGVSYDKKAEAWVVTTFDDFTDGVTYEVRVNGRSERFVASVGDVAKVDLFQTKEACLATDDVPAVVGYVNVKLYDAKGVDVTTRVVDGIANNNEANIFYTTDSSSDYSLGYNDIEFYEDVEAVIVATFNPNGVSSLPLTVRPNKLAAYGVEKIVAWTLTSGGAASWETEDIVHTVPAGEEGYVIATLLQDTRGDYYTTHQASSRWYDVDGDGEKEWIEWTENSDASFWKNGLYVQYKAMNPDKMLVEEYGEIASYEQGTAKFALYLYNYNKFDDEFEKELYSQVLTVCHPRTMNGMKGDANYSIMMNTKLEDGHTTTNTADDVADAYYSKFSTTNVVVKMIDTLHEDALAKDVDAQDANFEITLLTNQVKNKETDDQYEALQALVESYEDTLNLANIIDLDEDGTLEYSEYRDAVRAFEVNAKQFMGLYTEGRSQLKFKITETVTKKSITVTINLKQLVETTIKNAKGEIIESSDVAIVKELSDKLGVSVYYAKFALANTNLSAEQNIWNANHWYDKTVANNHRLFLEQRDQKNNLIGYDSNLYVAQTTNPDHLSKIYIVGANDTATAATASDTLRPGDRVMYVKDPSGNLYPVVGADINTKGVANTVYNKKVDALGYGTVATSEKMGITIAKTADSAVASNGATVNIGAYELRFRSVEGTEYAYAKDGRYTIVIQTIEDVDNDQYVIKTQNGMPSTYFVASGKDYYLLSAASLTAVTMDDIVYCTLNADNDWVPFADKNTVDTYKKGAATVDPTLTWGIQVVDATGDPIVNTNYGKVYYASGSGLKTTAYITVDNNNPQVTYAGRDLTRIEDTLYYTETGAGVGEDDYMKEVILEAFNFNLSSLGWTEDRNADGELEENGTWKLSKDDILYFTYTVSPTNNQIVINTVTFKVPVVRRNSDNSVASTTGNWYRSTCTINKSLTFND